MKSCGVQLVLQAAVGDGLSFDPFSFCQNGWAASEVDVGRGEVVDALVVAAVIVQSDEITPIRPRNSRFSTRGIRGSGVLFMSMR